GGARSRAGTFASSVSDDRVTALLRGLAPLGHRNYALYWVGQLVSMSGTWIELTATTWLLYQLTDSPFLLGLGGLFRAAPIFALALIGGTVADRVERRRLLLITQSSSVVTSLVLGALVRSSPSSSRSRLRSRCSATTRRSSRSSRAMSWELTRRDSGCCSRRSARAR